MPVRVITAAVCAVLLLTACAGDDDGGSPAAATLGGDVSTSSTTTTVGVDEVPAEITVEYVQRVMDALDESWGEMFRLYLAEGGPTAETEAWLDALYDEPALSAIKSELGREAAHEFEDTKADPGRPETRVRRAISTLKNCLFVEVDREYKAIFADAPQPGETRGVMSLVLHPPDTSSNRTAWAIAIEGRTDEVAAVEDPCAAG